MQPKLLILTVLALSFVPVGLAQRAPRYPLTVSIVPLPPTSAALQGQGCSYNCYSGEVECKSKQARNFQLAESSNGNTYELKCLAGSEGSGCPVPLGTYPARLVKQTLQIRVSKDEGSTQERAFSVLSTRPTQARGPIEHDSNCGMASSR